MHYVHCCVMIVVGTAFFNGCAMESGKDKLSQYDKVAQFLQTNDNNADFEEFDLNEYKSEMGDLERVRSIENLDELFQDSGDESTNYSSADLMAAVMQKDKDLVQRMLVAKVNPNEKNEKGYTPLGLACMNSGDFDIVKSLCEAKADPTIKNDMKDAGGVDKQKTALELAQYFNRKEIVQYLTGLKK